MLKLDNSMGQASPLQDLNTKLIELTNRIAALEDKVVEMKEETSKQQSITPPPPPPLPPISNKEDSPPISNNNSPKNTIDPSERGKAIMPIIAIDPNELKNAIRNSAERRSNKNIKKVLKNPLTSLFTNPDKSGNKSKAEHIKPNPPPKPKFN